MITCPVDMEFVTDKGSAVSTKEFPSATATDSDGKEPRVICTADAEPLELGQNTITCTASDSAGNDASCTYIITVVGKVL